MLNMSVNILASQTLRTWVVFIRRCCCCQSFVSDAACDSQPKAMYSGSTSAAPAQACFLFVWWWGSSLRVWSVYRTLKIPRCCISRDSGPCRFICLYGAVFKCNNSSVAGRPHGKGASLGMQKTFSCVRQGPEVAAACRTSKTMEMFKLRNIWYIYNGLIIAESFYTAIKPSKDTERQRVWSACVVLSCCVCATDWKTCAAVLVFLHDP